MEFLSKLEVPIQEWLRKDLSEYGEELVLRGEASRQFLETKYLRKLWSEHRKGLRNWSTELWAVMMFNLWFKNFAKSDPIGGCPPGAGSPAAGSVVR